MSTGFSYFFVLIVLLALTVPSIAYKLLGIENKQEK